jgi:hypothetical protein
VKTRPQIALAVTAGYMLGRTRKMRWALMLVTAGAAGRLPTSPSDLARHGAKVLGSSPELKTLAETVRGRLAETGKAALMSAATSQIDALSDRLQERTELLRRAGKPADAAEETADEDEGDWDEEPGEDEAPEEERPARKKPERRAAPKSTRRESGGGSARREPEEPEAEESAKPQRRAPRPSGAAGRSPVRRTRR